MLSPKLWKQRRFLVAAMLFFGFFNIYSLRVNLSVAIVAMTREVSSNGTTPEFEWNSKEQGLILSSFFYGYITTQLLGGYMAVKIGGRRLYGGGVFCTAVLTLLTPFVAKLGIGALLTVRIIEGICEGVTFPSLHAIWSKWAPPLERSRLNSVAFGGSYLGTVIMLPVCGFLAGNFGWQSVFYVTGGLGCVWYFLWLLLVKESPEVDPYISIAEKQYILDSLGRIENQKTKLTVPWSSIFTSPAVWAIAAANFSETWGFNTLLTQIPTFLKDTLKLNVNDSGLVSALPYLALSLMLIPSGFLADWSQKQGYLTTTQVRRYFNCGAFLAQAIFMLVAAYAAHPIYSIVALVAAIGSGAFTVSGFCVNHLDIAPQYAGILFGISNTVGSVPGIVSPLLTGYIVQSQVCCQNSNLSKLNVIPICRVQVNEILYS